MKRLLSIASLKQTLFLAALLSFPIGGVAQAAQSTVPSAETLYQQGTAQLDRGDFDGAIETFTSAVALDPNFVEAHCDRGLAYAALGDYDQAIAGFQQAVELDPDHADAYLRWGVTLATQGNTADAIEKFTQTIEADPIAVDAYYNRGLAHYATGDQSAALTDLQQAATLFQQQDDQTGYQQTLGLIRTIQQQ